MKYDETARRLKKAMSDIGITAQELSAKSGIGKSSISGYINGNHCPGTKAAYAMGKVLGVDPVWLMDLDVASNHDAKYIDQEAAAFAEFLKTHPEYKGLFDASRKVKAEDLEKAVRMLGIFTEE